jgi:hypothetical protein
LRINPTEHNRLREMKNNHVILPHRARDREHPSDFLLTHLEPTIHDHDLIAHALNERFVELGGNHPVPYFEDRNDA